MGRTNDEFSPLTPLDPRIDAILVKGIKPVAPPKKNTGRKICLCNVLMAVVASAALAGLAYFTFSYRRIQNDNERLRKLTPEAQDKAPAGFLADVNSVFGLNSRSPQDSEETEELGHDQIEIPEESQDETEEPLEDRAYGSEEPEKHKLFERHVLDAEEDAEDREDSDYQRENLEELEENQQMFWEQAEDFGDIQEIQEKFEGQNDDSDEYAEEAQRLFARGVEGTEEFEKNQGLYQDQFSIPVESEESQEMYEGQAEIEEPEETQELYEGQADTYEESEENQDDVLHYGGQAEISEVPTEY